MIVVASAGQCGKTKHLIEMHRFRKQVFSDRMGWNVPIRPDGLEVDQFDTPDTVYIIVLDPDGHIMGSWRLNPTTGPTMVHDLWPDFLNSINMPRQPAYWEVSRLAVTNRYSLIGRSGVSRTIEELFCAATELCLLCGITRLYGMFETRIGLIHRKLSCKTEALSDVLMIDGMACRVGGYATDDATLARIRAITGISEPLVTADMVPPNIRKYFAAIECNRMLKENVLGQEYDTGTLSNGINLGIAIANSNYPIPSNIDPGTEPRPSMARH